MVGNLHTLRQSSATLTEAPIPIPRETLFQRSCINCARLRETSSERKRVSREKTLDSAVRHDNVGLNDIEACLLVDTKMPCDCRALSFQWLVSVTVEGSNVYLVYAFPRSVCTRGLYI